MDENARINFDDGDAVKIGAAAQFLTETAVRLIEALGQLANVTPAPAELDEAKQVLYVRETVELAWAATAQAMAQIPFVLRFDEEEALDKLEAAVEADMPVNDNEVGTIN